MLKGIAYLILVFLIMGAMSFIFWLIGRMLERIEDIQSEHKRKEKNGHRKGDADDRKI